MHVVITGGAGFIGSHVADALLERGDTVHAFDNLSTGRQTNIAHLEGHERFTFTKGDVLDTAALADVMASADAVVHLAAVVGVKEVMARPIGTIRINTHGTENVLELADRFNLRTLIASTSEVYGKALERQPDKATLAETDDWTLGATSKHRWAYAGSKAMDEFLSLAYHMERDLAVTCLRFFNTVGPRQSSRYGMVIPTFVRNALAGAPLTVHGDGTQTRCFTHVSDAVRATVGLLDAPATAGQVYNVGNHEEVAIGALAEDIVARTQSASAIEYIPYAEVYGPGFEDMKRRTPDLTKINAAIGYTPHHSLDDILTDVIASMQPAVAVDV